VKHLIIDFIKRWKWWLAGVVAFHLFYIVVILLEAKTNFFLCVLAVAVPALVSYDLQSGTAKVHSFLPVQRRTLANAYWTQAVLLPTVVIPFGMLIEACLIGTFKRSALGSVGSISHIALLSFAFAGTLYFILTFIPLGPQQGVWNKILAGVTGGSWGLIFALGIFLSTDTSIHRWSTLEPLERILLAVGVGLGIVSFFTSRRLVRYRASFRAGVHGAREATQARWIRFPGRTASLLEPWFMTLGFSQVFVLGIAAVLLLIFAFLYNWNTGEAVREILDRPRGPVWYGWIMIIVMPLIGGSRSLWSLRLIRTLPLTGWKLTGVIVSFPMVAWFAAWTAMFILLLTLGRLDAFAGFTRLLLVCTGPLLLALGFLVRHGMKHVVVAMAGVSGLVGGSLGAFWTSSTRGVAASLSWPVATLSAVILSAVGILIIHQAITGRSQTYRVSNFMGAGGMGR